MTTTYATVSDVATMTGGTVVTTAQVTQAHYEIELLVSRCITELTSGTLHDSDSRWLKRAIVWQAKMIKDRPDKDIALDSISLNEAGVSLTVRHEDTLYFHPYAIRAARKLSWLGARTVNVTQEGVGGTPSTNSISDWRE